MKLCQRQVVSPYNGFISAIDSMEIGLVGVLIGAGRKTVEGTVDFAAGIEFHMKPGMFVREGDILATVYTEREVVLCSAAERVLKAYGFSDDKVEIPPLIAKIVTKDGVEPFLI